MASKFEDRFDKIYGMAIMAFFALMQWSMFALLLAYAVPRTQGWWNFAAWNGVLFFGCAGLFMSMYLAPKRRVQSFARPGRTYRVTRARTISLLSALLGTYAAAIIPAAALFMIFATPGLLFAAPSQVFPALARLDLWAIYQSIDNFAGLFFVVIPLIIALPWLYPKLLGLVGRMWRSIFVATGIQLDPEGMHLLGPAPVFIPWTWVRDAGVVVHGYAEKLVLFGSSELYALRGTLDPRLPKSVRNDIEFTGDGLPVNLEYLSVRPTDIAELIRREFLEVPDSTLPLGQAGVVPERQRMTLDCRTSSAVADKPAL